MTSTTPGPKVLLVTAFVAGAVALPASAGAATTFGSRLNHDPANSGECASPPAKCTLVSFIHPSAPNGDPNSSGAPVSGVITKFRIRAFGAGGDPATVTFRLANIFPDESDPDSATATAAGTGPTVTIPAFTDSGDVPIRSFPARLRVKKGNHLALDGTNVWATINDSGDRFSWQFTPPLVQGAGARTSTEPTGELLVAARIERDRDHDGFGDETQDRCPRQATTHGQCRPPKITHVRVSGGKVRYRLNERASIKLTLQKASGGGFTTVGHFKAKGKAGKNSNKIPKRIRHKLGSSHGRVVIRARDAGGLTATVKKKF